MPGFSEPFRSRPRPILVLSALLLPFSTGGTARAQIISPGRLSSLHSNLEGMGNCTQCHVLRTPGVDRARCITCHESLGERIQDRRGYHGRLTEDDCGTCHKEHLGEEFSLVRMDPDTFAHALTGYTLRDSHQTVGCRDCHAPGLIRDEAVQSEMSSTGGLERTYLGLDRSCASCHADDDPHRDQFGSRDCASCHTEGAWEDAAAFDHAQTDYPLTGRHGNVECAGCHVTEQGPFGVASIRYARVEAADCSSCHEDPHSGRMPGGCRTCHSTRGWDRLDASAVESRFDHAGTSFALEGAHARAPCRACHARVPRDPKEIRLQFSPGTESRAYPMPESTTCTSCHLDFHEGVFADPTCDLCHGSEGWMPPDFDRSRHQMEEQFELTGAHAVTPCSACHETGSGEDRRLRFRFDDPGSCRVCHTEEGPHENDFGSAGCDLCHLTTAFGMARFDHSLLGEAGWAGACSSCHEADDPHGNQFSPRDCRDCHDTESYSVPAFDHGATRFPLDGAHAEVGCEECHKPVEGPGGKPMTRFRPLDTSCVACHGGAG